MTIVGIGIDIIKISRFKKLIKKYKEKISKKILCQKEFIEYKKYKKKENFLAKRFTAKEATLKALGIGLYNGLSLKNIRVKNNKMGKPKIKILKNIKKKKLKKFM